MRYFIYFFEMMERADIIFGSVCTEEEKKFPVD